MPVNGLKMPRPGYRAKLENGLKLDLNHLARRRFIRPGAATGPIGITWNSDYWGEIASGAITADMSGENGPNGWLRITLRSSWSGARPAHPSGGSSAPFRRQQWFFICPYLNRRCMVLWMPPGARDFGCRQRWGRPVAYNSQFLDRDNRAHQGQARINSRLCSDRRL